MLQLGAARIFSRPGSEIGSAATARSSNPVGKRKVRRTRSAIWLSYGAVAVADQAQIAAMKCFALIVAAAATFGASAFAAGVDSRAYSCAGLQALTAANRFVHSAGSACRSAMTSTSLPASTSAIV